MSNVKVVGLGHQARVGKDTFADYYMTKYGSITLSFAAPLHKIAKHIQKTLGKSCEKDGTLLQMIGTALRERYGEDVFVIELLKKIQQYQNAEFPPRMIIVTDVRFPNEAAALRNLGAMLIKITRSGRVIDRPATHISETALSDYKFDHVIDNSGTIEEYYGKIDTVARCLLFTQEELEQESKRLHRESKRLHCESEQVRCEADTERIVRILFQN